MNPEIKQQWVDALRSGRYAQGHGRLALAEGDCEVRYCCLGVLCDLAVEAGVVEVSTNGDFVAFDGMELILPDSVVRWADVPDSEGWVDHDLVSLADRNDGGNGLHQHMFAEIADIIEANL